MCVQLIAFYRRIKQQRANTIKTISVKSIKRYNYRKYRNYCHILEEYRIFSMNVLKSFESHAKSLGTSIFCPMRFHFI